MLAAQPMLCSWKHFLKPRPWKYDEIWIGRALTQDGVLHPEEQNNHLCVCECVCVHVYVCVYVCAVRFYNLFLSRDIQHIFTDHYSSQHGKHKPSDVYLQESTRSLLAYPGFARGIAHT